MGVEDQQATEEEEQVGKLAESIEKVKKATGFVEEDADRAVEEHDGWHYGERVRVIEDNEDEGVFAGDVGYLIIGKVGAVEYGNVRTWVGLLPDGMDSPVEVSTDAIEEE